jgi:hypothetical protein
MQYPTGTKLLLSSKVNAGPTFRLFVNPLIYYLCRIPSKNCLIFTVASFVVISEIFFSYKIFLIHFNLPLFFLVFRLKSLSIFHYICHHRFVFIVAFKKRKSIFQREGRKRTLTSNRSTLCSLSTNR